MATTTTPKNNFVLAFLLMILCTMSITGMATLIKFLHQQAPISMMLFIRFAMSFLYVSTFIAISRKKNREKPVPLISPHWPWHLFRAILAMGAISCFFIAATLLPLVNATLLFSTAPIYVPIFVALIFKIKTNFSSWFYILLGLVGVVLIIHPKTGQFLDIKNLIGVLSGIFAAFAIVIVRKLSKTDMPKQIMFSYYSFGFIIFSIIVIFTWQNLAHLSTWLMLLGVGVFGTSYQIIFTYAIRYAPSRLITPMMNLSIIFSALSDWYFWHVIPSVLSIIGIVIVISAITLLSLTLRTPNQTAIKK